MKKLLSFTITFLVFFTSSYTKEKFKSTIKLKKYKSFLKEHTYIGQDWSMFKEKPKSRYHTLRKAFEYFEKNKFFFVYFDSWEDLKNKINTIDFTTLKNRIKIAAQKHQESVINKWKNIFDNVELYHNNSLFHYKGDTD